jgi:hypothetical protein
MSEDHEEILPGQLAVPEDLGQKPAPDRLAAVNGHHGAAAVGVTEEVMAALDPDDAESELPQCRDEADAGYGGKAAHAVTTTR